MKKTRLKPQPRPIRTAPAGRAAPKAPTPTSEVQSQLPPSLWGVQQIPEPSAEVRASSVDMKLEPQDEALYKAFQSNLLSLISHELRTPLTGIINALGALDHGALLPGLTPDDLIKMARENASRLHQALTTLLDLAALESGTLHARLREVDVSRIVEARLHEVQPMLKEKGIILDVQKDTPSICLGDAAKLARAIDLSLQVVLPRMEEGGRVQVRTSGLGISFTFELASKMEKHWDANLEQTQGAGNSPYAAFRGVMQSERAFLSRVEDGFGSEFLLIHEIVKMHEGKFSAELHDRLVTLSIELPELSTADTLKRILKSRAFQVTSALGAVTLILVQVPHGHEVRQFREEVQRNLYRTTDGVYELQDQDQVAIVLDDFKVEDASRIMDRMSKVLNVQLHFGVAHCPTDCLDPEMLIELSEKRLQHRLAALVTVA